MSYIYVLFTQIAVIVRSVNQRFRYYWIANDNVASHEVFFFAHGPIFSMSPIMHTKFKIPQKSEWLAAMKLMFSLKINAKIIKHNDDQCAFVSMLFIGQQVTHQPITNAVTGSSIIETIFDRMQRLNTYSTRCNALQFRTWFSQC